MNTNAVIIEPPQPAISSIIWLHGLGANGHDFEPLVPSLPNQHTRFIFPHAPERPITINGGMVMPGWYDIYGLDSTSEQDAQGIRESELLVCQYIASEIEQGIDSQQIILAGFSQGGAIALHTGLRYPKTLGGILALSTYLPLSNTVDNEIHAANRKIPIFMGHGEFDPVVPFSYAEKSRSVLEQLGYNIEWHTYPMQHNLNPDEIIDISNWLTKIIIL